MPDKSVCVGIQHHLQLLTLLFRINCATKLNVDKVHLELLLRLDTNQQRRSSSSNDHLGRVVNRLEHERKRALLQDGVSD